MDFHIGQIMIKAKRRDFIEEVYDKNFFRRITKRSVLVNELVQRFYDTPMQAFEPNAGLVRETWDQKHQGQYEKMILS